MSNILNINGSVMSDNSITSVQDHIYNPYTSSYDHNDEIRIPIQQQDLYLLISDSSILVDVQARQLPVLQGEQNAEMVNFFVGFLFDEIRYEINGIEIDRNKNVGITTMMKSSCSFSKSHALSLYSSSFRVPGDAAATLMRNTYEIPLRMLLGVAEDFNKLIMNAKHELILVRSRSDINSMVGQMEDLEFRIMKIQWKVPHVQVSDRTKLALMKYIEKKISLPITFRSWELYEYPVLPHADKHVWAVKTTNNLNKPRYVIVGLQTNRKNVPTANATHFDHCNIQDVNLSLNTERYPYEKLDLNFGEQQYSTAYSMYTKFQESYYNCHRRDISPFLTYNEFNTMPLFVFDCSRQNESIKSSMVDIRLEITARENFPENTAVYCLIIHDNVVTYNPFNNIVSRAI